MINIQDKKRFVSAFGVNEEDLETYRSTPDDCKLTLNFDTQEETVIPYSKLKECFENNEQELFFENRKNLKYMIKILFKNFIKENGNNIDNFINKYKRIVKKDDKYYLINTYSLNETMINLAYSTISCTSLISRFKIQKRFNNLLIINNLDSFDKVDLEKMLELLNTHQEFLNGLKDMAIDANKIVINEIKTIYYRFNTVLMDITLQYADKKDNLPINIICNNIIAVQYIKNSDLNTLLNYTSGTYFNSFLPSDKT